MTGKRTNEPAVLSIGSQPWKAINHPGHKLPWLPKEHQKPSTERTYYFPNESLHPTRELHIPADVLCPGADASSD